MRYLGDHISNVDSCRGFLRCLSWFCIHLPAESISCIIESNSHGVKARGSFEVSCFALGELVDTIAKSPYTRLNPGMAL